MPSFDIVSELDMHEVNNAVDQANRELSTRYNFNKVDAKFELAGEILTLQARSKISIAAKEGYSAPQAWWGPKKRIRKTL